jgi:hypothetical protein
MRSTRRMYYRNIVALQCVSTRLARTETQQVRRLHFWSHFSALDLLLANCNKRLGLWSVPRFPRPDMGKHVSAAVARYSSFIFCNRTAVREVSYSLMQLKSASANRTAVREDFHSPTASNIGRVALTAPHRSWGCDVARLARRSTVALQCDDLDDWLAIINVLLIYSAIHTTFKWLPLVQLGTESQTSLRVASDLPASSII